MMCMASCPLVKYSVAESVWSLPETQEKLIFHIQEWIPFQTATDSTHAVHAELTLCLLFYLITPFFPPQALLHFQNQFLDCVDIRLVFIELISLKKNKVDKELDLK